MRQKETFFELDIDPIWQAAITIGGIAGLCLLILVPSYLGLFETTDYLAWTISASLTLLYATATSVLSLGAKDKNRYWARSVMGYVLVAVIGGMIAYAFSGLTISEAKSFRWIYIVFTVGFVLFMTMLRAMRKIVEIAEKQDSRLRGED